MNGTDPALSPRFTIYQEGSERGNFEPVDSTSGGRAAISLAHYYSEQDKTFIFDNQKQEIRKLYLRGVKLPVTSV